MPGVPRKERPSSPPDLTPTAARALLAAKAEGQRSVASPMPAAPPVTAATFPISLSHGLASVGGRRRRAGSRSGGHRPYQRKPKLGVRLELVGVQGSTEFDAAFATIKKKRPDALIVEPDNIFYFHSKRIVDFATKSRLP